MPSPQRLQVEPMAAGPDASDSIDSVDGIQPAVEDEALLDRARTMVRGCVVECLRPWGRPGPPPPERPKNEDRIWCGLLADRWPAVLVADGTTKEERHAGGPRYGRGAAAAETAIAVAKQFLSQQLASASDLASTLKSVRTCFDAVSKELNRQEVEGHTTLLVCLLYELPKSAGGDAYWCFAYEGDGHITVVSPKRELAGRPLCEYLLSPGQKLGFTAAVSRRGCSVPPVVGCTRFEPGDIVYTGSDGLDEVIPPLEARHVRLPSYVWESVRTSSGERLRREPAADVLERAFGEFTYQDDVVIGVITSEEQLA